MNWPKIILIGYLALGVLMAIAQVGKPRKPTTGGVVALATVFTAAVAFLVVIA